MIHLVFEISASPEAQPEPQEVKVLTARYLSELELQSADVRPPITEFLLALREGDALVAAVSRSSLVTTRTDQPPVRPVLSPSRLQAQHAIISVM